MKWAVIGNPSLDILLAEPTRYYRSYYERFTNKVGNGGQLPAHGAPVTKQQKSPMHIKQTQQRNENDSMANHRRQDAPRQQNRAANSRPAAVHQISSWTNLREGLAASDIYQWTT